MVSNTLRLLTTSVAGAVMVACSGGGSGNNMNTPTPQNSNVSMLVSDASSEDWSMIGVEILSIALVPQGGGANVTVYTAPIPAPTTNLAQLDNIADLLGSASVPAGTYTSAVLTVSANPGDISLITSPDPEAGFVGGISQTIDPTNIQIQHKQGSTPNLTVPMTIKFESPLVANAGTTNMMDIEFDLAHPAFIMGHVPPGAGTTLWAVNFDGPVRHHPVHDLTRLVLRHMYGDVSSIAGDNSSITVTREFPTRPVVNPETAVAGNQSVQVLADAANGTIFYDLDAKTKTVIMNFSAEASLVGKNVRVAARYQEDGTLVATRIWASSQFNNVWLSPEGHVLHVNAASNVVTVADESGRPVDLVVDANTQFFFRQPQNGAADAMPIGTGTAFLSSQDLVRGFKVHASVVDVLATPLVAESIDIETARYDGKISNSSMTGFTYTRVFRTASDDYSYVLDYINGMTPNGTDDSGNAITGYKFWNFAYPTLLTSGSGVNTDFMNATDGSVNLGGAVGAVPSYGVSYALWNDPANPGNWSAAATVLMPSLLPLGFVQTGLMNDTSFTMNVLGGATAATVDVGVTSGNATLVYQVDRTDGIVTVSAIDVTTTDGQTALTQGLAVGAPVKVYGIPQADGSVRAYALAYFTGDTMPAQ
jgi:Domain of unknown function (DUF4382)/Domain of unknown function (DUF5666)